MENKYQEIKDAVKKFEACQKKYLKFGAWDTEPDSVFQWAIADAWAKGENTIKHDPNYWQLFTCSMNCNKAGKELGKAANKVVQLILSTERKDSRMIGNWLQDYCWRTSWCNC